MNNIIYASWPAPKTVTALTTTRQEGCSQGEFKSFNLALHVSDNPQSVGKNRALLRRSLRLPSEPLWLKQQHTSIVIPPQAYTKDKIADGIYTNHSNIICAVLTADCLPILLCNRDGTEIAALHAGWRGLLQGIIEAGIKKFKSNPRDILVWLGPAIGPSKFEVSKDLLTKFINSDPKTDKAFSPINNSDKWLANIYQLAKQKLINLGINNIYGGDFCTYSSEELFFSYRRDGQTGRMSSIIWKT